MQLILYTPKIISLFFIKFLNFNKFVLLKIGFVIVSLQYIYISYPILLFNYSVILKPMDSPARLYMVYGMCHAKSK